MIKVTVVEQKTQEEKPEYPKLMRYYKEEDFIVLFESPNVGTVVLDTSLCGYPVGHFSKEWVMENFIPFTGSITLTNE